MEISKTAVLLANEHHSDQKKCYTCYKRFSYTVSLCNRSRKHHQCQLNARECGIKEIVHDQTAPITVYFKNISSLTC